ncbi:hypothetical protein Glove_91g38 [Diversispora epigaea]|uniref:Uncharacterized protein n=1 Tax=Diversispora epigaea TaxID=1348612 RepID=A0A397J5C6_9GLOM|nr:hypothetical protein Glove_91g38 [Diversispora epigaea]
MCFSTAKWQREEVQDHKFDFVDVNEFHESGILRRLKYSILFIVVIKSILVYVADMWTAGILVIFDRWNSAVQPKIPFAVSKWIFVGCIIVSFLLLAWDIKKARHIIKTRDISYAFTSTIAYRFYTLRSYKHYNFFCQINNSKKKADEIAFFVFFTFKGWKRLVFAEAPRQVINAITLVSIIQSNKKKQYLNINSYGENLVQQLAMGTMVFTLVIFVASFTMLVIAFFMYIPLLCHIRGNLKEYCCHKIDKRIGELLKKKTEQRVKQRRQEAEAEAKGDFSHLKNKRGIDNETRPLRQPTLPTFEFSDEKKQSYSPFGQMPPPPLPNLPYVTNQVDPVMGAPPYGPRSGTPRTGTPTLRNGNPGYGPPPPFMGRRNSNSSIRSDMTAFSAYSSTNTVTTHQLTGPGYPVPSRIHTPNHNHRIPNVPSIPNIPNVPNIPNITPKRSFEGLSMTQQVVMVSETTQNRNSQRFSIYNDEYYGGALDDAYNSNDPSTMDEFNSINFRPPNPPRMRSHSPTPSISSTTSGRSRPQQSRVAHPALNLRYQEQRGPRYNNYTEQGGGQSRTDGLY